MLHRQRAQADRSAQVLVEQHPARADVDHQVVRLAELAVNRGVVRKQHVANADGVSAKCRVDGRVVVQDRRTSKRDRRSFAGVRAVSGNQYGSRVKLRASSRHIVQMNRRC